MPRKFSLANYAAVLGGGSTLGGSSIYQAFFISVAKTVVGVAAHLVITGAAAYAMTKENLVGRNIFIKMGVVTMFFGGGMIPTYLVITDLGLLNNFLVYIIPVMFSFYDMIILMNFFRGIPKSLEESAKIDGAGFFQIFFKIIIPLSMPVFSTIALFHGVYQWNDYMTAKLYITTPNLQPLSYKLYMVVAQSTTNAATGAGAMLTHITSTSIQQATMVVTTLPIILVYPFLQKYFISGMLVGGVKE